MRTVAEWIEYWDRKGGISDPIEMNGYCVGHRAISADVHRRVVVEPYLARLELQSHHHVLDIGCGSGLMLEALVGRVERCVGVEPSRTMAARYKGRAEVYGCAAHELPFADESFDRILMASVAHYFPSTSYFEAVVVRALRLLRRGGIFLIGDVPLGRTAPQSAYLFYGRRYLVRFFDRLGHPFSIAAQPAIKRAINLRYDIIVYKD